MNFQQTRKMKDNEETKLKSTPIAMVAPELKQNEVDTEITKTCAVLGCEESKTLNTDSFFRFPEDQNLRQIWADLTGRNNWTPTDYSYICVQHFSVDCFECNSNNTVVLVKKAVPSLKLPNHVLEVEYIEDEAFDNEEAEYYDEDMECEDDVSTTMPSLEITKEEQEKFSSASIEKPLTNGITDEITNKTQPKGNLEVLQLFTEVQKMQNQAVELKEKLRCSTRVYNRQNRLLSRLKEVIEIKKNAVKQKQKKRARILLSLQDKIRGDTNGLVLAMPTRHTDDLKNLALSVYKYSPQAYIYIRNTLRTLLPSTDVLDTWITAGYQPKNVVTKKEAIKLVSEITETELSCKISLR